MSMEEDVVMYLQRIPAIAELVGTRVTIDYRPQDTNDPAIVVMRIDGGHEHMLTGSAGWARPMFHVMAFADSAVKANKLRDRMRTALNGFSGVVGETNFGAILIDDEDHDYIPPIDANDRGTYSRLLVCNVIHAEYIPQFN